MIGTRSTPSRFGTTAVRAFLGVLTFAVALPVQALEITTTGIIGWGTPLQADGTFLAPVGQNAYPLNNSGTVLINTVYSNYPDPGHGFLLTRDGLNFLYTTGGGPGTFLRHYGFTINNIDTITYQRGPIFSGTTPYNQLFDKKRPYGSGPLGNVTEASELCPCSSLNLYTNFSGQGVTLVTIDSTPQVLRLNGDGTATALAIDPTYLTGPQRPAKILESGDIYVAVLNRDALPDQFEIWRFAAGETAVYTVVYTLPSGALTSWDVNEDGDIVVGESDGHGAAWVKRVPSGGPAELVDGTLVGGPGTPVLSAQYSRVFINRSGRIAALRSVTEVGPAYRTELVYADPGGIVERVLGTDDVVNGGVIRTLQTESEMNEWGQLTVFMQLEVAPPACCKNLVIRVNPVATPVITALSPASGPAGAAVRVTGADFTAATEVTFNGVAAAFTVQSPAVIVATVPAAATTGPVEVTTPVGTGTSPTPFIVTASLPPAITGLSPSSGGVGTSVAITGANLGGATSVTFNGVSAAFQAKGLPSITATVPAGATTGPVTVTTPGGTAASPTPFTVVPAPTITDFSPPSGGAGTAVTITGTNLTGARAVMFNGTSTRFTVVSPTTITTTVPIGATTGPISVTTPGGMAVSAASFSVSP